jgi:hypothetical protein
MGATEGGHVFIEGDNDPVWWIILAIFLLLSFGYYMTMT